MEIINLVSTTEINNNQGRYSISGCITTAKSRITTLAIEVCEFAAFAIALISEKCGWERGQWAGYKLQVSLPSDIRFKDLDIFLESRARGGLFCPAELPLREGPARIHSLNMWQEDRLYKIEAGIRFANLERGVIPGDETYTLFNCFFPRYQNLGFDTKNFQSDRNAILVAATKIDKNIAKLCYNAVLEETIVIKNDNASTTMQNLRNEITLGIDAGYLSERDSRGAADPADQTRYLREVLSKFEREEARTTTKLLQILHTGTTHGAWSPTIVRELCKMNQTLGQARSDLERAFGDLRMQAIECGLLESVWVGNFYSQDDSDID